MPRSGRETRWVPGMVYLVGWARRRTGLKRRAAGFTYCEKSPTNRGAKKLRTKETFATLLASCTVRRSKLFTCVRQLPDFERGPINRPHHSRRFVFQLRARWGCIYVFKPEKGTPHRLTVRAGLARLTLFPGSVDLRIANVNDDKSAVSRSTPTAAFIRYA